MLILQAIIDGILIGGFYALMAAGLTLVFGVMEIVNFAQGILVVLGAYLSYALYSHLHIDPFVGLLITLPAIDGLKQSWREANANLGVPNQGPTVVPPLPSPVTVR